MDKIGKLAQWIKAQGAALLIVGFVAAVVAGSAGYGLGLNSERYRLEAQIADAENAARIEYYRGVFDVCISQADLSFCSEFIQGGAKKGWYEIPTESFDPAWALDNVPLPVLVAPTPASETQ